MHIIPRILPVAWIFLLWISVLIGVWGTVIAFRQFLDLDLNEREGDNQTRPWSLVDLQRIVNYSSVATATMSLVQAFLIMCLLRYYSYMYSALRNLGLGSHNSTGLNFETAERGVDALLPTELKNATRFTTISCFRLGNEDFPFDKALQEYHREPIHFALALAELNIDVFKATHLRNPGAVRHFRHTILAKRRNRDVIGHEVDEYSYADILGMSILQHFRYWKANLAEFLEARTERHPEQQTDESLIRWEVQLWNFCDNVRVFCQYTGSEVDDLALPRETINNLRKFASNRRQELAPLLEENARLNRDLTRYKRINAALQTRHTIEKLVFELPETAQYDFPGSGPKWQVLWSKIWEDASRNPANPFHKLWADSKGEYARKNIFDKGRDLFADMSGEIHGYDHGQSNAFDYEHFDVSARRVATILHENLVIDQSTGDVDWALEIRKYPVAWPSANNMALTELERLEGRVQNLQRRLDHAMVERDRERDKIQEAREAGRPRQQEREQEREAFDVAQADLEEESGFGALFGDGE